MDAVIQHSEAACVARKLNLETKESTNGLTRSPIGIAADIAAFAFGPGSNTRIAMRRTKVCIPDSRIPAKGLLVRSSA